MIAPTLDFIVSSPADPIEVMALDQFAVAAVAQQVT
jgi:hypothetical protein